jgi:hypothetical protein
MLGTIDDSDDEVQEAWLRLSRSDDWAIENPGGWLTTVLQRINDYALPLEDKRAFESYGAHSGVNKVLIINREWMPGRITVVFVDEPLGF